MPSIRQEILEVLEKRPGASSGDLSRSLGVSPADIRHHLRKLEKDGLVQAVGLQPARRAGRPSRVYALARHRDGSLNLADAMLTLLKQEVAPLEESLHLLVEILAGEESQKNPRPVALTQRLLQAVQRLNQLNYQARWEARASAPQINLGNCPYVTLVEKHPELCKMDGLLIAKLVGQPATQMAKLRPNPQGIPVCIFLLGRKTE